MVLASGGDLPDNAKRWLGNALLDISEGKPPSQALCLARPNKKPYKLHTFDYAVDTEALCLLGMRQEAAAGLVAATYGDANIDVGVVKKAHNQLRKRQGLFKSLLKSPGAICLRVLIPHEVIFGPQPPEITYPEIDDIFSPEGVAEIYRRRREHAQRSNGYVYYDEIRVPPDPPEKIVLSDYENVEMRFCFPGEFMGYAIHEKLLAEARKELGQTKVNGTKRNNANS